MGNDHLLTVLCPVHLPQLPRILSEEWQCCSSWVGAGTVRVTVSHCVSSDKWQVHYQDFLNSNCKTGHDVSLFFSFSHPAIVTLPTSVNIFEFVLQCAPFHWAESVKGLCFHSSPHWNEWISWVKNIRKMDKIKPIFPDVYIFFYQWIKVISEKNWLCTLISFWMHMCNLWKVPMFSFIFHQ